MTSPTHPADRPTGLPEGIDAIGRLAGGVLYALTFDDLGRPVLDWSTGGSESSGSPLPIADYLAGRCDPAQASTLSAHLAKLRSGRSSSVSLAYPSPGGLYRRLRDAAFVQFDRTGSQLLIFGLVREETQDEAVPNAHLDLWRRRMLAQVGEGLASWDADRRFVLANGPFARLLAPTGVSPYEGESLDRFLARLAASREIVLDVSPADWIDGMLSSCAAQEDREWRLADGRCLDLSWRDMDEGLLLRVQDTTLARSGEQALRKAKEVADEGNAKKSRFLQAANHDLRQPLATLKILLFTTLESRTEAERRELLNAMDVTVGVMEEILESLLQVGQLDAERVSAQKHHFQASQMLDRLRIEFTPLAAQKGIDLNILNSLVTLETDRSLLERVLSNFIANAIRFTERGGILVGVRRRKRAAEIQVFDTGRGIAADQLGRIFDEFHQVDDHSAGRQRGLGLGLNIAQRLADLLGHDLRVSSRLHRGSMFSVTVPLGDIWKSRIGDMEITERLGGEFIGVKVLVIEDNEDLRHAVEVMLRRWGVDVLALGNGATALEVLASGDPRPDLVLVDYRLPNGDFGTDVLARVRGLLDEDIPGIICTADTDTTLLVQMRNSGVPVLIKPISPPRLRSLMHHLLYERVKAEYPFVQGSSV